MLNTNLGKIEFLINNKLEHNLYRQLENKIKTYNVDNCFQTQISIDSIRNNLYLIECKLNSTMSDLHFGPDNDEDLAMITYENISENEKLSIGTIGDLNGVSYEYSQEGLALKIDKEVQQNIFLFNIAWISNYEQYDVSTFYAGDPNI